MSQSTKTMNFKFSLPITEISSFYDKPQINEKSKLLFTNIYINVLQLRVINKLVSFRNSKIENKHLYAKNNDINLISNYSISHFQVC